MTVAGRRFFHSFFAVLFAGAIVLGVFGTIAERHAAAQGAAFAAAPPCPTGTVPTGNCVGWEQETVSSIESRKGSVGIHVRPSGQTLWFEGSDASWPDTLTSGVSVPVLVWRNEAQALREPSGKVHFSDGSAGHSRYDDIAAAPAWFGFVLLVYAYISVSDTPPLRIRRPRLWWSLIVTGCSAGAGFLAAGIMIQIQRSVVAGIISGAIAFVTVAPAIAGIAEIVRRNRLDRAQEALTR